MRLSHLSVCQCSHSVKLLPRHDDLATLCSYPVCTRDTLQRHDKLKVHVSEPVISHRGSRRLLLGNPEIYLSSWPFCSGVVLPFRGTVLCCAVLCCPSATVLCCRSVAQCCAVLCRAAAQCCVVQCCAALPRHSAVLCRAAVLRHSAVLSACTFIFILGFAQHTVDLSRDSNDCSFN